VGIDERLTLTPGERTMLVTRAEEWCLEAASPAKHACKTVKATAAHPVRSSAWSWVKFSEPLAVAGNRAPSFRRVSNAQKKDVPVVGS